MSRKYVDRQTDRLRGQCAFLYVHTDHRITESENHRITEW